MGLTMDNRMFIIYSLIGGIVVSAVIYFGSHSRSNLAAFIAFLPTISVITICTIYYASGTKATVSYVKNMVILLPPWMLYAFGVIYLLPRIGLAWTLIVSVGMYLVTSVIIMRLIPSS